MKRTTVVALVVIFFVFMAPLAVHAAVPQSLRVLGYLADQSGGPEVPVNATVSMTFRLFDQQSGGVQINSASLSVQVVDGVYEATLPFVAADFDGDTFLEIEVESETLAPRISVASAPYAFRADSADAVADGAVDNDALATAAVTLTKIAPECAEGESVAIVAGEWACATIGGGGPVCGPEDFVRCYTGNLGDVDVGLCRPGRRTCKVDQTGFDGTCVAEVLPVSEICDGADNDCNGAPDDGIASVPCATGLPGVCADGGTTCAAGVVGCQSLTGPSAEVCDSLDNDCNGVVDENTGGSSCSTGLPGVCASGTVLCQSGSLVCNQDVSASAESCNGVDDDCDGGVDEEIVPGSCGTGLPGACAIGEETCSAGTLSCQQTVFPAPEGSTPNGIDDDCNGGVDDFVCPPTEIDCSGQCFPPPFCP